MRQPFLHSAEKPPTNLSNIVEVSVWNAFQLLKLCHFIQHFMKVELGGQKVQPSVTVGFPARQNDTSEAVMKKNVRKVIQRAVASVNNLCTHVGPSAIIASIWLKSIAKVSRSG